MHLFIDASIDGVCTVADAVIYQPSKIIQSLITSNCRLAKRYLTITCLELITPQNSENLSQNIKNTVNNEKVRNFYAWSYSTVFLDWYKDKGKYKVFVSSRVAKIRNHGYLEWNYIQTRKNPADLGSRG